MHENKWTKKGARQKSDDMLIPVPIMKIHGRFNELKVVYSFIPIISKTFSKVKPSYSLHIFFVKKDTIRTK